MATIFNSAGLCSLFLYMLEYVPLSRMFLSLPLTCWHGNFPFILQDTTWWLFYTKSSLPLSTSTTVFAKNNNNNNKVPLITLQSFFQDIFYWMSAMCWMLCKALILQRRINHNFGTRNFLLIRTNNCKTMWQMLYYSANTVL